MGGVLPQAVAKSGKTVLYAGIAGFLAGMAPDIDVFIRSSTDPLLFLEFHRQFTHSLIFIPVGGLISALVLFPFFKRRLPFRELYLFTTLGYGTHGLLDACTTYGTQLFWPFSNYRVAWNNVSIIDPLFTLPVLALVIAAAKKRNPRFARIGLAYGLAYLLLGVIQNERAERVGEELARSRGHSPVRLEAKPTFGNLLLWKVVYETHDEFFVDAVQVGFGSKVYPGDSVAKLDVRKDLEWLDPASVQYQDVLRFQWFSNGYVAHHPTKPHVIGDIRYSLLPNQIEPLWGIRLNPAEPDAHVSFENFREDVGSRTGRFWRMIVGAPLGME